MTTLSRSVEVRAEPQQAWDAIVDWEAQGEWIPATHVRILEDSAAASSRRERTERQGVGTRIDAFTGFGKVGFLDKMTLRVWEPPTLVVVWHHGRVVRGSGSFEVTGLGGGRTRVTWSEHLELPLGVVGRVGWVVVRPLINLGFDAALKRLARRIETVR